MSKEIHSIADANNRLAQLGQKRRVFTSLKAAQAAVAAAEKRKLPPSPYKDPNDGNPNRRNPKPINQSTRESLLAAIDDEKSPGAKADLYAQLSASILAERDATSDMVAKTDLNRAYQRSEANRAYCLHAEASLDPMAAKSRKLMRLVE
jgi:hypothetical protein